MISVVVDPFAEKLVDAERADLRMKTEAGHVVPIEAADQADAVRPECRELRDEFRARADLVAPRLGDGGRIPGFEPGRCVRRGREDLANAAGEPRRSASIRWPTHSFALHSPCAGRQPDSPPRASISATTVVADAARRSAITSGASGSAIGSVIGGLLSPRACRACRWTADTSVAVMVGAGEMRLKFNSTSKSIEHPLFPNDSSVVEWVEAGRTVTKDAAVRTRRRVIHSLDKTFLY